MIKTSIIIRCYNEEGHIGRLLHGIMKQTIGDFEIIIVDSGSTDSTLSIASRFPVKIVTIKPEDFSFGRSLNIGCKVASGDYLIFASAHVYPVYKNWLECLVSPFSNPEVALVYGKQRGNKETKYSEHQVFHKWFPNNSNQNQDTPFCNNANSSIRREIWKKIPYNEKLTGLEDIDWANRAIQAGLKITYNADAEVVHVHNENPLQTYNRYRREAIALKTIFPNEKFHFGDFISFLFFNVVSDYGRAFRDRLLLQNWLDIPRFRLMQFMGTYKGFTQQDIVNTQLRKTFYYPNHQNRTLTKEKSPDDNSMLINYLTEGRSYREDY